MHFLRKPCIVFGVLACVAIVATAIYFVPLVAALLFLTSVAVVFAMRLKHGNRRHAWKELLKSLFLDW